MSIVALRCPSPLNLRRTPKPGDPSVEEIGNFNLLGVRSIDTSMVARRVRGSGEFASGWSVSSSVNRLTVEPSDRFVWEILREVLDKNRCSNDGPRLVEKEGDRISLLSL